LIKPPKLDARDLQRALRALRSIEKDHVKQLRAELKGGVQGVADRTAKAMPQSPTLSGFARSPGWGTPQGKVSFTPGRSRKNGNKLLAVKITSSKEGSILISEFAGNKSKGKTATGRSMIESLNNIKPIMLRREGRFAYPHFRTERKTVFQDAKQIIEKYMDIVERQL